MPTNHKNDEPSPPVTPSNQVQSSVQLTEEMQDKKLEKVRELKPRVFASSVASYVSFAVFVPTVIAAITLLAKNPSLFSNGIGNPEVIVLAVGAVAIAALISGITSAVVCSKQFKALRKARNGVSHRLHEENLSGSPFKPPKKLTPIEQDKRIDSIVAMKEKPKPNSRLILSGWIRTLSTESINTENDDAYESYEDDDLYVDESYNESPANR